MAKRLTKIRKAREPEDMRLAGVILPKGQARPGLFMAVDISSHSDDEQRAMVRSGGRCHITGRVLGYRCVQVLDLVHRDMAEEGRAPSYSMICDELGISTKGEVAKIVGSLERRGLLRRVGAGRVRRIRL